MTPNYSAVSEPWMRRMLLGIRSDVGAVAAVGIPKIDEELADFPHFDLARTRRGRRGHGVSSVAVGGDCMGLAKRTPDITRLLEGPTSGRPESPVHGVHPGARARALHSVVAQPGEGKIR